MGSLEWLIIGNYILIALIAQTLLYRDDLKNERETAPSPGLCIVFGILWPITAMLFVGSAITDKVKAYRTNHPDARTPLEFYLDTLNAILPPWGFRKDDFAEVEPQRDIFDNDPYVYGFYDGYDNNFREAVIRDARENPANYREDVLNGIAAQIRARQLDGIVYPANMELQIWPGEQDTADEDLPF